VGADRDFDPNLIEDDVLEFFGRLFDFRHRTILSPAALNDRDIGTYDFPSLRLADKIGSLTPGKEADLLLIRADDINLYPSNNAIGTVVQAATGS
jgi:hypothetical protein